MIDLPTVSFWSVRWFLCASVLISSSHLYTVPDIYLLSVFALYQVLSVIYPLPSLLPAACPLQSLFVTER